MKHKWHDCIVAWAEGKEIEAYDEHGNQWYVINHTPDWEESTDYRIKKEPVIEVKYFTNLQAGFVGFVEFKPDLENWHLKITYQDGKAVKAELPE